MASKCIRKLTQLWRQSVSPNIFDDGLHACVDTCSITALMFGWSWPHSVSSNPLNHNLRVHLQVYSTTTSKCIYKYTLMPPRSASPSWLNHTLVVYLWVHLIITLRHVSNFSHALPASKPVILCVDWLL